jgi:hypothetical protein
MDLKATLESSLAVPQKVKNSRAPVAHPVILATQEAEIRIAIQSQPQANNSIRPYLEKKKKSHTHTHTHTHTKASGVVQGVGPEIKSHTTKRKKKKITTSARSTSTL